MATYGIQLVCGCTSRWAIIPVPGQSQSGIPKKGTLCGADNKIQTGLRTSWYNFLCWGDPTKIQSARDARVQTIPRITVH
jgi:hypothetical protein